MPNRPLFALVLLLASVSSCAAALEVVETRWGFGGKAVAERFNLVSILFHNPGPRPFDGEVNLRRDDGGQSFGAPLAQRVYVTPGTSRWVQFCPYLGRWNPGWVLAWRDERHRRLELPTADIAAPATVLFEAADSLSLPTAAGLRRFDERLFPETAGATDGLAAVALDHVPAWAATGRLDQARRRAFLDWLHRGGVLHLLHDGHGAHPQFGGDLAVLDTPRERFHVGAGVVLRHAASRRDAASLMRGPPPDDDERRRNLAGMDHDVQIAQALRRAVDPDHAWWLIYTLGGLYLVLVGPANWAVGRFVRDYRAALATLLATVGIFGFLFDRIGRRGYDEVAVVHTVAYARPVSPGAWDVAQWSNLFVTASDRYAVRHGGSHNLYATVMDLESVPGVIHAGADGFFDVRMPLYSNRAVVHRGRFTGGDLLGPVRRWEDGSALHELVLDLGPAFPERTHGLWVRHGGRFYDAHVADGRLHLKGPTRDGELRRVDQDPFHLLQTPASGWGSRKNEDRAARVHRVFRYGMRSLLRRAAHDPLATARHHADPGRAEVFICADLPAAFGLLPGGRLGAESGQVLYHVDVFKPQAL